MIGRRHEDDTASSRVDQHVVFGVTVFELPCDLRKRSLRAVEQVLLRFFGKGGGSAPGFFSLIANETRRRFPRFGSAAYRSQAWLLKASR